MAVAGPALPTVGTSAAEAPWSDNDWTSAGNLTADDGTSASCTAASFDSPDQTFVLKATGFDFSAIPDGSTVNGVTCRVNAWFASGQGSGSLDLCQLLDVSRAKVGTNQCSTPVALTTTTSTIITKGSASDLWGNALTAAWVKDPDFGVALGVLATAANADVFIDYVTLEIDYTAPATPNTGAASGAVSWVGSTTGTRPSSGAASGALAYTGTATGAAVHSGAASASVTWAASATGAAPSSVSQGSAAGSVAWSGTATGSRQSTGAAISTVARVGSAIGARASAGAAAGALALVGAATGARASNSAVDGAITWTAGATGSAPAGVPEGSASGAVAWSGVAIGAHPSFGEAAGLIGWAGSATGAAASVAVVVPPERTSASGGSDRTSSSGRSSRTSVSASE